MEEFQAGGCGGETPSGGITEILAFANHLHAQKLIYKITKTFQNEFKTNFTRTKSEENNYCQFYPSDLHDVNQKGILQMI